MRRMSLLPDKEIIAGPAGSGATLVMSAFLHADEAGGRFTDGRLGGWYAAFAGLRCHSRAVGLQTGAEEAPCHFWILAPSTGSG